MPVIFHEPEPDLRALAGHLLVDEGVLGTGVEVAERAFEPAALADRRRAGREVGPLCDRARGVVA